MNIKLAEDTLHDHICKVVKRRKREFQEKYGENLISLGVGYRIKRDKRYRTGVKLVKKELSVLFLVRKKYDGLRGRTLIPDRICSYYMDKHKKRHRLYIPTDVSELPRTRAEYSLKTLATHHDHPQFGQGGALCCLVHDLSNPTRYFVVGTAHQFCLTSQNPGLSRSRGAKIDNYYYSALNLKEVYSGELLYSSLGYSFDVAFAEALNELDINYLLGLECFRNQTYTTRMPVRDNEIIIETPERIIPALYRGTYLWGVPLRYSMPGGSAEIQLFPAMQYNFCYPDTQNGGTLTTKVGDSGSPVRNSRGELIGMHVAGTEEDYEIGLFGYAVPASAFIDTPVFGDRRLFLV